MRESFSLCEKNLYSQPVSRRRNNREHGYLQCYTCNSTPASRISLSGCLPLVPCTLSLFPPLLPALLFKNMQQETGLAARSSTPFNRVYVRAMEKKKRNLFIDVKEWWKIILSSRFWLPICPGERLPLSVSSFASPLSPMNILKRTPETSIRCLRDSPLSQCFYYLTSAEALVVSSILSTPLLSPPPATRYIVFLRPNKSRFTHQSRTLIYRGVARLRLCTVRVFIIRESNCFTGHTISSLRP